MPREVYMSKIKDKIEEFKTKYKEMPEALQKKVKSELLLFGVALVSLTILLVTMKIYSLLLVVVPLVVLMGVYFIGTRLLMFINKEYSELEGVVLRIENPNRFKKAATKMLRFSDTAKAYLIFEVDSLDGTRERKIEIRPEQIKNFEIGSSYIIYLPKVYDFNERKIKVSYKNIIAYKNIEEDEENEEKQDI